MKSYCVTILMKTFVQNYYKIKVNINRFYSYATVMSSALRTSFTPYCDTINDS